MKSQDHEVGMS